MDRALCAGTTRSSGQALRSGVTASFLPWIEEAAVLPFRIVAGAALWHCRR
jgi:hypothetical protein